MSVPPEKGPIPGFEGPLTDSKVIIDKFVPRNVYPESRYRRLQQKIEYKDLEPRLFIGTAGNSPTGIPNGIEMHSEGKRYLFIRKEFNLYEPEYDDITDTWEVPQKKMSLTEIEFFLQRTKEVLERNSDLDELRNHLNLAEAKYKELQEALRNLPQIR